MALSDIKDVEMSVRRPDLDRTSSLEEGPMPRPSRPRTRRQPGFTLVELLVVILIIGILVALLVPVIAGAVGTARNAQVTGEITILQQALASFNNANGFYPPSRIILNESLSLDQYPVNNTQTIAAASNFAWLGTVNPRAYSSPQDITIGQLAQRSVRFLRKMFPKMGTPNQQLWHDFNGNGVRDQGWILLEGHECLAFFLGGVPNATGTGFGMSGFSKNPQFPFLSPDATSAAAQNRTQPLFEFRAERLVDEDGDGMPGYIDPRNGGSDARFYGYFSAYDSNGYDPNDVNMVLRDFASADEAYQRAFSVNFPLAVSVVQGRNVTGSPGPNPYTASEPVPTPQGNRVPPVVYINKESYQLISAGTDGIFGPGGQYLAESSGDKLPSAVAGLSTWPNTLPSVTPDRARYAERDNLSNFTRSTLE
jgi:general secretion pathway protein G